MKKIQCILQGVILLFSLCSPVWVKQCKQEAENAKISVRNARRDAIEALKKSIKSDGVPEDVEKDAEAEVQKIHDKFIKKIDELYAAKEKEVMTV